MNTLLFCTVVFLQGCFAWSLTPYISRGVFEESRFAKREACEDNSDYNCEYFASVKDYCEDNEAWTRKNCPVSCEWCVPENKPPAQPIEEVECKDDPRYPCNYYASVENYCADQKTWTGKHCPVSCGFCEPATSKAPAPPEDCKDKEGEDCSDMSQEFCIEYKEETLKLCPKTCGWCVSPTEEPQPSEARPVCEDKFSNCARWSSRGYCIHAYDWMKENCPKSCDACKGVFEDSRLAKREACEDNSDYNCEYLASVKDYCEDNEAWTRKNCPVSCEWCVPENKPPAQPIEEVECKDDPRYTCKYYASVENYCADQEEWTRKHCPVSCGYCGGEGPTTEEVVKTTKEATEATTPQEKATTKAPAPPEDCKDKEGEDCSDMSQEFCIEYKEETLKLCPKTCGWCVSPTEEPQPSEEPTTKEVVYTTNELTEAPTTTEEARPVCEDKSSSCATWSSRGQCISAYDWMKENCPKSCDACKENPTTEQATEQQTTGATPETTEEATQATTEKTTSAEKPTTEQATEQQTTEAAPETTEEATQAPTEQTTPAGTRPACEDKFSSCARWSSRGQCNTARDWMKNNCPRSCGMCEEKPTTEQPTEQQTTEAAPETTEEATQATTEQTTPAEKPSTEQPTEQQITEEATQAPTEQTTPMVTRPDCKDKDDDCEEWSNKGQCSLAVKWMADNCPKSCGLCKEPTKMPEEKTTGEPAQETTLKPATSEACALRTRHGYCCVFPFIFEDKEYTSCTKDDIGELWCSLTRDYHENGQWDFCEDEVPTGTGPTPKVGYAYSCQNAFNLYRTAYETPRLEWDDKIAADALKWAQFLASTNQLIHEPDIELGETLYKEENPESPTTCKKAAEKWFEQINEYERLGFCDSPPSQAPSSVSDFVQLMWKGTTKFGVGIAGQYLVARYSPKGNVAGKVADNVRCDAEP